MNIHSVSELFLTSDLDSVLKTTSAAYRQPLRRPQIRPPASCDYNHKSPHSSTPRYFPGKTKKISCGWSLPHRSTTFRFFIFRVLFYINNVEATTPKKLFEASKEPSGRMREKAVPSVPILYTHSTRKSLPFRSILLKDDSVTGADRASPEFPTVDSLGACHATRSHRSFEWHRSLHPGSFSSINSTFFLNQCRNQVKAIDRKILPFSYTMKRLRRNAKKVVKENQYCHIAYINSGCSPPAGAVRRRFHNTC